MPTHFKIYLISIITILFDTWTWGHCLNAILCTGSQFKLDSTELNSRSNLTLGASGSTRMLSASTQSSSNKHEDSNHTNESANDSSKKNIFLQFLPASRFVALYLYVPWSVGILSLYRVYFWALCCFHMHAYCAPCLFTIIVHHHSHQLVDFFLAVIWRVELQEMYDLTIMLNVSVLTVLSQVWLGLLFLSSNLLPPLLYDLIYVSSIHILTLFLGVVVSSINLLISQIQT